MYLSTAKLQSICQPWYTVDCGFGARWFPNPQFLRTVGSWDLWFPVGSLFPTGNCGFCPPLEPRVLPLEDFYCFVMTCIICPLTCTYLPSWKNFWMQPWIPKLIYTLPKKNEWVSTWVVSAHRAVSTWLVWSVITKVTSFECLYTVLHECNFTTDLYQHILRVLLQI